MIATDITAPTIIAWTEPSPSSPAPAARRCAASGLDRSVRPGRVVGHAVDANLQCLKHQTHLHRNLLHKTSDIPLGGHIARCENAACGHTEISYNSCGNRHCPKCQGAASRRWLADREAELLPVPYFHVVYTLPSQLRDIAYQNKRVLYNLLMKAAAETTLTIAADPKRLGARIGVTAVLHTWGSVNPHS